MSTEKQPSSKSLDDDYFIKNAISCFLHYYPDHKWAPIYKELRERESFNQPEPVIAKPSTRKPKV
jgi:hypothetical protein